MNTKKKKKGKRPYEVDIDMTWSMEYCVRATSQAEAKKKAWDKFCKRPPRKCFTILSDRAD